MRTLLLVALVLVVGCKKEPAAVDTTPEPPPPAGPRPVEVKVDGALHAVRCGDVTAIWTGTKDGEGPLWFFADSLSFQVGDAGAVAWKPPGEVFPHNRSFDVFSPDCAWVLLATDNYGPYHLVAAGQLPAYLEGKSPPALVGATDGGTARVHTDQKWVSQSEVEFFGSCCGGVEVFRAKVTKPDLVVPVFFAPEAPHGLRRTDRGFEVNP